ncbi:DUF4190 domain-containing protein [Paenibacillus sp. IB182496]|uniref:DUF4190 domain-containing protein n=1 Tax=Paenibacillus sabuli TaxID=2772509 RepID=A0A927BRI4_9BACL|nr:DUF4190 domain-containing protein [Paenibacillus sabuli]MBD2844430.1 DUF4190 domain-containing protein [Paenibacillus sabuli]
MAADKHGSRPPRRSADEVEASAELAPFAPGQSGSERVAKGEADLRDAGRALGWTALGFAIASWFVWPLLLGAAAVVLGAMAYRQGGRRLGVWSIALGLIAFVVNLVVVPLYYSLL